MREFWVIARREFATRVRSKVFVFLTVTLPLFMALLTVVPTLFRGGGQKRWLIVDSTPAALGREVRRALEPLGASIEVETGTLAEKKAVLNARIMGRSLDGYLALPADLLEHDEVSYHGRSVSNVEELHEIARAVTSVVQRARLLRAGLSETQAGAALSLVQVQTSRVTQSGEESSTDALSSFIFAYAVAFAVFMMITIYGNAVMRSVLEEKSNRIVEVLLSSIDSRALLAGKIVGVASVALFQISIWFICGIAIVRRAKRMLGDSKLEGVISAMHLDAQLLVTLAAFFVLGFLLFASLFAAVGAAVTTEQEAHQVGMLPQLIAIAPMLMLLPITADPHGTLATTFGLIPLTAPVVMPLRLGTTQIPTGEVLLSLLVLALSTLATAILAAKIYRAGVLSTGRRPTLRELLRWLRL